MTFSKFFGLAVGVFALVGAGVASAQAPSNGILTVYVQVINQNGTSYVPSNFTVSVSGQSASPSSFQGSQSGTVVSLNPGSYNVTVATQYGFTSDYSVGCNNTIAAGQNHTCVITLNGNYQYPYANPYPYYQYPYSYPQYQNLTCSPQYQTLPAGRTASFTAQGGVGGTYNWFTNGRTYANVGPVFTTVIENTGSQLVTVTNGAQTATCSVTVTATGGYYPTYPTYPTYQNPTYVAPTYTYSYHPKLPNTGFAPVNGAALAFATVLLLGSAFVAAPYVRKAFASAVR